MDLIPPPKFVARNAAAGLYIGPSTPISRLSGPPIDLHQFDLKRGVGWRLIDPRRVDLRLRSLVTTRSLSRRDLRQRLGQPWHRIGPALPRRARPFLLLWLAHRVPEFGQLLASAPMIAVLIVHDAAAEPELPLGDLIQAVREESLMSRAAIVESRGFVPQAVTGLAKVMAHAADPVYISGLRVALAEPEILRSLSHAPRVGRELLAIHADARLFCRTDSRFRRLLADPAHATFARHAARRLERARQLSVHLPEVTPARFSSPKTLAAWFDRVDRHADARSLDLLRSLRFPMGPLQPDPAGLIRQIRNGTQALAEAIRFDNCICKADLLEQMRAGKSFLYVTAASCGLRAAVFQVAPVPAKEDDRGTDPNGGSASPKFAVIVLEGRRGADVPRATREFIRECVENQGGAMHDPRCPAIAPEPELFEWDPAEER